MLPYEPSRLGTERHLRELLPIVQVFLNLVLEFVPETVYRISKHYSKNSQRMPTLFVKLYVYQVGACTSSCCWFCRVPLQQGVKAILPVEFPQVRAHSHTPVWSNTAAHVAVCGTLLA